MHGKRSILLLIVLLALCSVTIALPQKALQGEKIRRMTRQEKAMVGDKCKVHGEKLKLDVVPILYGKLMIDEDYMHAQEKQFPNANTRFLGGCIVEETTEAEVLYCPKCRDAEAQWQKEHRGK